MAKEKKYKLALTLKELELVFLEFESCLGVGAEDPSFRSVRDKAVELLRSVEPAIRSAQEGGAECRPAT